MDLRGEWAKIWTACLTLLICCALQSPALAQTENRSLARKLFRKGLAVHKTGKFDEARTFFERARQAAPGWALPHLHWAIVETHLNPDNPQARVAFETAANLSPTNPRAHYRLALSYERAQLYDAAARELRKALSLRPGIGDANFRLAGVLQANGDLEGAIQTCEELLSHKPRHMGALSALAEMYETRDRIEDAEIALRTIAQMQPTVAYHQYQLAQFYERHGARRKAKRALKKANAIDPRPQRKMRRLR